jgi:phage terminase large subunit
LGPEHDWSSHAADAFGLMAICYEGPDGPGSIDELFGYEQIDAARSEMTGY